MKIMGAFFIMLEIMLIQPNIVKNTPVTRICKLI